MRRLWKGLFWGSLLGGLAYLALRPQAVARRQGRAGARGRRRGLGWTVQQRLRDVQGAWRVGRRVAHRRRLLRGLTTLTRRLLL